MRALPFHINESELAELLSSTGKGDDPTDDTARWQARLMLQVGELLEICRLVADAKCVYFGQGQYMLTISQETRRRAKLTLKQLERRSVGRTDELPQVTVTL